MLGTLLITFREGLEAALIVSILLAALSRIGQSPLKRYVWFGVLSAVAASVLAGLGLTAFGYMLEGEAEEIYEGLTMLVAVGFLSWMMFWMRSHARVIKEELEQRTRQAAIAGTWALFGVAFIAVVREGLETVLFLIALYYQQASHPLVMLLTALMGLSLAVLLGYFVNRIGMRINLRLLFQGTTLLLLFVAAGLLAGSVHAFQEVGLLPIWVEHLWDTTALLDETSVWGQLMHALFGYNANPSLLEVVGYWAYLLGMGYALFRPEKPKVSRAVA